MSAARRTRRKQRQRRRRVIYGLLAAAALIAGLWAVLTLRSGPPPSSTDPAESAASVDPGGAVPPNTVQIFHIDEEGTALVSRAVSMPAAATPLVRARLIVERQLEPPEPPLLSPFPDGTALRTIYLTPDGDAFVDLSRHASEGHPGGSLDELFTVYALVNALALNMEEINAVQILIEGREVDTLKGHVDLRRPLGLNLSWVAPDDAAVDLAAGGSRS